MTIEIKGNWEKGYALDIHTISSEYLGKNQFGHAIFDTIRSKIGELVYKLKYKNDIAAVKELINEIKKCLSGIENFDFIIPIPPSNVDRPKQPVQLVCEALSAEFKVTLLIHALIKNKITEEIKNVQVKSKRIELLKNSMVLNNANIFENKKVLLIDDLYGSGATLSVATDLLYNNGKAKSVSVLTLTKNRTN